MMLFGLLIQWDIFHMLYHIIFCACFYLFKGSDEFLPWAVHILYNLSYALLRTFDKWTPY